jgi:hypothetical protein
MLALFCLRLAAGMLACLVLLSPGSAAGRPLVNPNYFRTHFLTALALAGLGLFFARAGATWQLYAALGTGLALAFLGSLIWSLEGAPAGSALTVLCTAALAAGLGLLECASARAEAPALALVGGFTSAALLGAALSAMLMGHSYLIAPAMSLTPLMRLLAALALALGVRMLADGYALGCWTARHSPGNLTGDALLWLPLRWGLGFAAPLGLTWMAWQTARIRSTQSATGILYVVVIFCLIGELTALLLRDGGLTL